MENAVQIIENIQRNFPEPPVNVRIYPRNGINNLPYDKNDMKNELARLCTFLRWKHYHIMSPIKLAEAGWFFLGPGDRVRCPFCKGCLEGWTPLDIPMMEHKKFFPWCPFVLQKLDEKSENTEQQLTLMDVMNSNPYHQALEIGINQNLLMMAAQRLINSCIRLPSLGNLMDMVVMLKINQSAKEPSCYTLEKSSIEYNKELTVSELQNQISKLDESRICKVCVEKTIDCVAIPCGHLVACSRCLTNLKNCPICRNRIQRIYLTYLS